MAVAPRRSCRGVCVVQLQMRSACGMRAPFRDWPFAGAFCARMLYFGVRVRVFVAFSVCITAYVFGIPNAHSSLRVAYFIGTVSW
jgi:hypothetical protein